MSNAPTEERIGREIVRLVHDVVVVISMNEGCRSFSADSRRRSRRRRVSVAVNLETVKVTVFVQALYRYGWESQHHQTENVLGR